MKPQMTESIRRLSFFFTLLCIVTAIGAEACAATEEYDVIVGFDTGVDISNVLLEDGVSNVSHKYNIIDAVALTVTVPELERLANNSAVKYIEDDIQVYLLDEELTWNIERVKAERVWGEAGKPNVTYQNKAGAGVRIGILDTGVDYNHPDIFENIMGGADTVYPGDDYYDVHGHGTHVAGTAAAMDNDIGVIGVAPHAEIYAVKVFDNRGIGELSDLIEGLEWALENNMDIVSMSLRVDEPTQSLEQALERLYENGTVLVAASGNRGYLVEYPAAYETVIAVGATDENNTIACFSGKGPEIELVAPGWDIQSLYKNRGYATMSGTSMAAPHVAGTAALILCTEVNEDYDLNNNGEWDPAEVRLRLRDTATNLGPEGWDQIYGSGLVNAYEASRYIEDPPNFDWNPWDDDLEITNREISLAEWHWATDTPINGHIITNAGISLLEYQWVTDDFS